MERLICFKVNGAPVAFTGHPDERLIDFLRNRLGLTGTKEGCSEGVCGSCTVLVDGTPIKACVTPLKRVEGREIETIEGIGSAASPTRCSGPLWKRALFNAVSAPRG